jgi:hypothetical protein
MQQIKPKKETQKRQKQGQKIARKKIAVYLVNSFDHKNYIYILLVIG